MVTVPTVDAATDHLGPSPLADPGTVRRPRSIRSLLLANGTLAGALALLSWPLSTRNLVPVVGLDPAWSYSLDRAVVGHIQFGTHFVFTYGPLGFLMVERLWETAPAIAAFLFWVAVSVGMFYVLLRCLRPLMPALPACVLAYLVGAVSALDRGPEILLVFAVALLVRLLTRSPHDEGVGPWALLGFLAGMAPLIKVSLSLFMITAVVIAVVCGRRHVRGVLSMLATGVGTGAAGWFATGNTLGNLPAFASHSIAIIVGYDAAQNIEQPGLQYQFAIAAVGIVLIAAFTVARCRDLPSARTVGIAIAVAEAVWVLAKESFVRHDSDHGSLFIAYVAILLAALVSARIGRVWVVAALVTSTVLTLISAGVNPLPVYRPDRAVRGFADEASALFSGSRRQALVTRARRVMQHEFGVPPPMVATMRGHTVSVDPWEQSVTWAYPGEVFDPLPVIQDYSAYTTSLDDLNAAYLEGHDAPLFILKQPNLATDNRVPIFEPPRTQVVMACRYRQVDATPGWQLLRRSANRCSDPRSISTVFTPPAGMVEVPRATRDDAVIATFSVPTPALWTIDAVVFHPPEVCVRSVQADVSGVQVNRFVVATAGDWHLLRPARTIGYSRPFMPPTFDALSFSTCGSRSPMAGVKVTFQSMAMAPFASGSRSSAFHRRAGRRRGSGVPSTASGRQQEQRVGVAPSPFLAGLLRADDGMVGRVPVGRGVAPGRLVAAAHVPALETQAQVHPLRPFAPAALAGASADGGRLDGVEVSGVSEVFAVSVGRLALRISGHLVLELAGRVA